MNTDKATLGFVGDHREILFDAPVAHGTEFEIQCIADPNVIISTISCDNGNWMTEHSLG